MKIDDSLKDGPILSLRRRFMVVTPGSCWRYFDKPPQLRADAIVDIHDIGPDGDLLLEVYPFETGPWGNKSQLQRNLEKLDIPAFIKLVRTENLQRVH
jgi:hypothetical protein